MKTRSISSSLRTERRVETIKRIIYDRLAVLSSSSSSREELFYLGLFLGKANNIINYLEEIEQGKSKEDDFRLIENKFKDLIGITLSLESIDKNTI